MTIKEFLTALVIITILAIIAYFIVPFGCSRFPNEPTPQEQDPGYCIERDPDGKAVKIHYPGQKGYEACKQAENE